MKLKQIFKTWKKVFSSGYLLLVIFIAFSFYSLNVLINNWSSLTNFYLLKGFFETLKFFFILFLGFYKVILLSSYISIIIISILFGVFLSLLVYKVSIGIKLKQNTGIFGTIGVFFGALVPGCTLCGVGLLSVLLPLFGLSAAFLIFLPLKGLELSILAIAILSFSVIKLSNDINSNSCKIKFDKISERRLS